MSGLKYLFLTGQGDVYQIPIPNGTRYKPVPQLANQIVLVVDLFYETQNRKPWRLKHVGFDRIQLNLHGEYILTNKEKQKRLYNFFNFGIVTAEELSRKEDPWPIPGAPVIPNDVEKKVLIEFLKEKYPVLLENSPNVIEEAIESSLYKHSELQKMVREASAMRRQLKRNENK